MVHQIKIRINGNYDIAHIHEDGGNYTFNYKHITITATKNPAIGYFAKLREIRDELEKMNIFLMINVSRVDVWAKSFFRCYLLEMGKPATNFIDNIFDEPERLELVATVKEQKEYYLRWANSLGALPPATH